MARKRRSRRVGRPRKTRRAKSSKMKNLLKRRRRKY